MAPKNLGFSTVSDSEKNHDRMKNQVMEEVKQLFKPEFLNRIDGVIVFRTLEKEQQRQIVRLLLKEMTERIRQMPGFELEITDDIVEHILTVGYQPQYGARPLRRAIQNELEDFLADEYLKGKIKKGSVNTLVMRDGRVALE